MASSQRMPIQLGGVPAIIPDVPILAVFIALFASLAASHMTLFTLNRKRGHFFIFNALTFGFGMSRIVACVMRLVWATRPTDQDVALVAQIFLNAGILLMYIVNVLFSIRLLRAARPSLGWHPVLRAGYKAALYLVIPIIIMVIVVIVLQVKQPTQYIRSTARDITKFGLTYFLVIAATPLVLLPLAFVWSRDGSRVDHFGHGSLDRKLAVVAVTTALAAIEAGFRAGTTWSPQRYASDPAWYDGKAAFYCFNFMLDVLIMATFLFARIDKIFFVPSGADGPGDYERLTLQAQAEKREKEGEF